MEKRLFFVGMLNDCVGMLTEHVGICRDLEGKCTDFGGKGKDFEGICRDIEGKCRDDVVGGRFFCRYFAVCCTYSLQLLSKCIFLHKQNDKCCFFLGGRLWGCEKKM